MNAPLLACAGLEVRIADLTVCRGLDLALDPGDTLAILGRNGAGKTTLLHTLAGLREPAAGELVLCGTPYARLAGREAARRRGLLPQQQLDAFPASVLETALVGRHPHLSRWAWEGAGDARIARQALARVGLDGLEKRDVQTLSGGERQRLAVAALLAQAPRVYLLDEPLAHLDLNHQIATLELFAGQAREQGAAVAMVLHDVNLALRYCRRALLLFGQGDIMAGEAAAILTADNLSRLYGHPLRYIDGGQPHFIPA